jgi:hypothetical protein
MRPARKDRPAMRRFPIRPGDFDLFDPNDIRRYVAHIRWPISRDDLLADLRAHGVPPKLIDHVTDNTDARRFVSADDLVAKLEGMDA